MVAAARERGLGVVGELELGWRLRAERVDRGDRLERQDDHGRADRPPPPRARASRRWWSGNVGTALTSLVGSRAARGRRSWSCEASSFQLEDTLRFAPDAGVLLNLAEDHLDRHGTFDAYKAAKLEVFARQPPGTRRGRADELLAADVGGEAERVLFGRGAQAPDGRPRRTHLWWDGEPLIAARRDPAARRAQPRERDGRGRGRARARDGARRGAGGAAPRSPASPHRLEEVATHDGVLYVNDSKATNVASAIVGIEAFAGGLHVILGGSGKHADYAPLAAPVAERARAVYLIGETAAEIGAALAGAGVPLQRERRSGARRGGRARRGAARRGRAALARLRLLRPVPRLRGARGAHFRALVR